MLTRTCYVLTSNRTFSAAEEFTYNLKNLKRATIAQALKTAHLDALKKVAAKQTDNPRRAGDFKRLIERIQKELDELKKSPKPAA